MSGALGGWKGSLVDDVMLDRRDRREDASVWSDSSSNGVVSTADYRATRAGIAVLEDGGNAVDAALAASFALSVVESAGSGLGGMAMALIHRPNDESTLLLKGACRAPSGATPELVKASHRYRGYRAVAVPGYVAAMEGAYEYATLPLARLLEPAIALASDGFLVTPGQAQLFAEYAPGLRKGNGHALFLRSDGSPPATGEQLVQPALAQTLARLAKAGLRDFYEGQIAADMVRDMEENQGFIALEDLRQTKATSPSEPIWADVEMGDVATAGSPAGGATLVAMLRLLDAMPEGGGADMNTPKGAATIARIIQRARADRKRYRLEQPTDPDRTSREYAEGVVREWVTPPEEGGETSHLSVVDRWGGAVSLTQSIERSFGSKVATKHLGFLYNGYMRAFKVEAKQHPHYLRPGAEARSNAAPAFVFDQGQRRRPRVVIGSTGSERMLSGILQVLVRLRAGEDPFAAVAAPRLHATPEGRVLIEQARFDAATLALLKASGYELDDLGPYAFKFGGLHLVCEDYAAPGRYVGVAEPRREGAAAGQAAD